MFHKIKTFIAIPEKGLLAEAWLTQLYVGLMLKFVPFKKIPALFPNPLIERHPSPAPGEGPGLGADRVTEGSGSGAEGTLYAMRNTLYDSQELESLKKAILLSSHYSFWRNKCLVQSLAARRMLKRRGISSQLSLGLRRDEHNKTYAHAWLKVGDIEIVEKKEDYLEMYVF